MSHDLSSGGGVTNGGLPTSRSAQELAKQLGHGPPPSSLPVNPLKATRFRNNLQTRRPVSGPIGTFSSSTLMNGLYLGDLNWWTTDQHIVDLANSLGAPILISNVFFSEHKVNGKSKGVAYVEFDQVEHAAIVKDWFDANEFQHHKMNAQLSAGSGGQNPFKTLPKEPYQRSTSTPNPSFRPDVSATRPHRLASSTLSATGTDASSAQGPRTPSGTWRSQPPPHAALMGQSLSAPAGTTTAGTANGAQAVGHQGYVGAVGVQGGAFGGFWQAGGEGANQDGGVKRARVEGVC